MKVTLDTPMSEAQEPPITEIRSKVSAMRRSYGEAGLTESELDQDPISQFTKWLADAAANPFIVEANAMVLSTLSDSQPTSRSVLLKDVTEDGFTFFTNYESAKAIDIAANANVSILFPWYAMERQVIVLGSASKIARAESEAYFATRPWSSQIGAWASHQSKRLATRETLENAYSELANKYPEGAPVPTPPHWGGYLITPTNIEFWQGRYSRLHDRVRYMRTDDDAAKTQWNLERYYP